VRPARAVLRWLPLLVPVLYFGLILHLQPADHLDNGPRYLFDDFDMTAMALRGLNATLGRTAGRLDEPEILFDPNEFNARLDHPPPLEDPYFLEYPHTALLLFQLGFAIQPDMRDLDVPSAVADGTQHDVLWHTPRNEQERHLYHQLRRATQFYTAFMIACLVLLMLVIGRGYEPGGGLAGPVWLLILPSALYFTANRFDIVPALLTALCFASLGRRWTVPSAVFLAAATMTKVYPGLLVPLVGAYLLKERRRAVTWAAAYGATCAGLLAAAVLQDGWQGTRAPYQFQLGRDGPTWATIYGFLLPPELAGSTLFARLFRTGTVLAVALAVAWRPPAELAGVLRRGLVVLIVFVSLQVFYSPQWVIWYLPLLVPLAGGCRSVLVGAVALDLVTYATFPWFADWSEFVPIAEADWPVAALHGALVGGRFAILGWIVWVAVRTEYRSARLQLA
jgi:hypothetical protein